MLLPSTTLLPEATGEYPEREDVVHTIVQNVAPSLDLTVKKKVSVDMHVSTNFTLDPHYNTYPIMGYVYMPTDIPGRQVQVQSSLSDFYWNVDTSNTLTEVNWAPSTLTADQTNDRYRPFRLK